MRIEAEVSELRRTSRVAFGQTHRLELMLAIVDSDDGLCTLTELAVALGVTMSSLQRPFQALIDLQLLSPLPAGDSRFRYYAQVPSAAWQWAVELASGTQLHGPGRGLG